MYVDYDFKLGKSVRVHHGITAVLRRDVPGPYRHCKNGASIRNLKPLAIFCGCTVRFVSDLVGNSEACRRNLVLTDSLAFAIDFWMLPRYIPEHFGIFSEV